MKIYETLNLINYNNWSTYNFALKLSWKIMLEFFSHLNVFSCKFVWNVFDFWRIKISSVFFWQNYKFFQRKKKNFIEIWQNVFKVFWISCMWSWNDNIANITPCVALVTIMMLQGSRQRHCLRMMMLKMIRNWILKK